MTRLVQIAEATWVDTDEVIAVTVNHEPKARLATLAVGLRGDVLGLTWQQLPDEARANATRIVELVNGRASPRAAAGSNVGRKFGWG